MQANSSASMLSPSASLYYSCDDSDVDSSDGAFGSDDEDGSTHDIVGRAALISSLWSWFSGEPACPPSLVDPLPDAGATDERVSRLRAQVHSMLNQVAKLETQLEEQFDVVDTVDSVGPPNTSIHSRGRSEACELAPGPGHSSCVRGDTQEGCGNEQGSEDTEEGTSDALGSADAEDRSIDGLVNELPLETSIDTTIGIRKTHPNPTLLRSRLRKGLKGTIMWFRSSGQPEQTEQPTFDAETETEMGTAIAEVDLTVVDAKRPVRLVVDGYSSSFMLHSSRIGDFLMGNIADTVIILIVAIASLLSSLVDPRCRYNWQSQQYEPVHESDSNGDPHACDSARLQTLHIVMLVMSLRADDVWCDDGFGIRCRGFGLQVLATLFMLEICAKIITNGPRKYAASVTGLAHCCNRLFCPEASFGRCRLLAQWNNAIDAAVILLIFFVTIFSSRSQYLHCLRLIRAPHTLQVFSLVPIESLCC